MSNIRPEKPSKQPKKKSSVGWCILWFFIGMLVPIASVGVFVGLIPSGTILGWFGVQDGLSDSLSSQSFVSILANYQNITVGDVPVLQTAVDSAINNYDLGKYISIDWSSLSDAKLASGDLTNRLATALKVTVSLESLEADGFVSLDSTIKKLPCFSEWVPANDVDPSAEGFVPAMYYYKVEGTETYEPAFTEDGKYIEGTTSSSTQLYLVNIYKANLLEAASCIGSRLQAENAADLLNTFAGAETGSLLSKIVGNRTIGELGELDASNIYLADIIEITGENEQLQKILVSWMGMDWEAITLEDLTSGEHDYKNIKISVLIDKDDEGTNQQLVKIIEGLIDDTEWDDITIGQLMSSDYSVDSIKISVLIDKDEEGIDQKVIDALIEACGDKEWEEITVGDLKKAQMDDVSLTAFKPYSGNEDFYKVLIDALVDEEGNPIAIGDTEQEKAESITLGDLDNFEISAIKLSSVISTDSAVFDVLCDLTGKTSDTITLDDISGIDSFGGLHLNTVISTDEGANNEDLYGILEDITGISDPDSITVDDLDGLDQSNFNDIKLYRILDLPTEENSYANQTIYDVLLQSTTAETYEEITIGMLSSFDTTSIKLTTVMPVTTDNEKLYNILVDMTGVSRDEITIGSLENCDVNNINIWNVMDGEGEDVQGNAFLKALYEATSENGLLVGSLGSQINDLPLSTVYGSSVFTQDSASKADFGNYVYALSTDASGLDVYTLTELTAATTPASGNAYYYIANTAGCWLSFCYDIVYDTDANFPSASYTDYTVTGRPYTITEQSAESQFKIDDLNNNSENIAKRFASTTLYTLVQTGLITDNSESGYSTNLLKMTIDDIVDFVNKYYDVIQSLPTVG